MRSTIQVFLFIAGTIATTYHRARTPNPSYAHIRNYVRSPRSKLQPPTRHARKQSRFDRFRAAGRQERSLLFRTEAEPQVITGAECFGRAGDSRGQEVDHHKPQPAYRVLVSPAP